MNKIVKNFNNFIRATIFKVSNKTIFKARKRKKNNFKISNFNKYSIVCIALLFFYLFYLLIPTLYEKSWIQSNIENKFFKDFKINLSSSADISYRILPAPHFLIKNSKISLNEPESQEFIADIKDLKIFLSQKNFFDKEKLYIQKVIIDKANFSLFKKDIKQVNQYINYQFSKKKITIKNSNIFFKNNLEEVIAITKIKEAKLFFDDQKISNLFSLKGQMFAVPFVFNFKNLIDLKKSTQFNLKAKSLKLNIFNKSIKEIDNPTTGKNILSIFNSSLNTKYKFTENIITFSSEDTKFSYNGKFSIDPFDIKLNVDLGNQAISKFFNLDPILIELIKSEILFNENLNINTSILATSNSKNEFFQNAKVYFRITNGKINFDNSRLINNKIGSLELSDSNLFLEDNNLVLNAKIKINIKNTDHLFSFLRTNKKSRKPIKNVLINLDYYFVDNQIKINNFKIDNNKVNDQVLDLIKNFSGSNLNNLIRNRLVINQILNAYEG